MSEQTRELSASFQHPRPAPGPKGKPLVGSLTEFSRDPLEFLHAMQKEYGEVAHFRLANMDLFQINHPEGVKHILQDQHHNYTKAGFQRDFIDRVVGNGLFTSEGDFWLRQRRLMQPMFHRKEVQAWGNMMVQTAQETISAWPGGRHRLDLAAEMMELTLKIANQALFSTHIDRLAGDLYPDIAGSLTYLLQDTAWRFERPFYRLWLPTERNRAFKQHTKTLDKMIYAIIEARRLQMIERPEETPRDLLTILLEARDEETGEGMSDLQLRDEVITLFIAGHETTANALSWAWYLLATHPQAETKFHAELDMVLGGRPPQASDLPNLPYTRMIVDETLRLYPPAWLTNRFVVQDDVVCGYRIPAGALAAISPYAIHRQAGLWEQAEEFIPERFSPEASQGRPAYAYLPFGGGPRLCIGKGFALAEAPLVLATIAARWRFRLEDVWQVSPQASATLRVRDGLTVILEAREN